MIRGSASGSSTAKPLDYKALLKAAEAALQEGGKSIKSDLEGATSTWENKPQFEIQGPFLKGSELFIRVAPRTNVEIFKYVNDGTQPHMIFPRKGKFLSYQRDFTPKTQPWSLSSGPGGKSGPYVKRLGVTHPGTEARKFTTLTAINHQAWWQSRVERFATEWCVQAVGTVTAL
jgi:hypothetical protein